MGPRVPSEDRENLKKLSVQGILSRELFCSSLCPGLHTHPETYWALPLPVGTLTRTLLSSFFSADFYLEGDPELEAFVMLLPPRGAPSVKEVLL